MIVNAVKSNVNRRLFVAALFSLAMIILAGCKFSFHDDVYLAAGEKYRVIAPAIIAPGAGTAYAFTRADVPTITITCVEAGAVAYYSLDGGAYQQYTGPFTLPVANYQIDQTIVLSAYTTHTYYTQSEPVSQTYQFVATKVPNPTIDVDIPLYYHFDNPPWIVLSCSLAGAQLRYSLDGGANYADYSGSFILPVSADWTTNKSYTITVYATLSGYLDSDPVSATLPFLAEGTIITIAGNGVDGFSGDGGPATEASLSFPQGIYVDAAGNVYIADTNNNRIRMVDPNGNIWTRVGNGVGTANPSDSEGILATDATVQNPQSIAVDEVNHLLYVVDNYDFRIRTVPLAGGSISSFTGYAGTTYSPAVGISRLEVKFPSPCKLFYDSAVQKLYILDYTNHTVWGLLPGAGSALERIAGNGSSGTFIDATPATSAAIDSLNGIAKGSSGDLYLTGGSLNSIIGFTPGGAIYHTACSGLTYPSLLCGDGTNLYFLNDSSKNLMRYTISSVGTTVLCPSCDSSSTVLGDGGPASGANLNYPSALFVVPHDGIYIADTGNHRVRKIILY